MAPDNHKVGKHARMSSAEAQVKSAVGARVSEDVARYGRHSARYGAKKAGMALWKKIVLGVVAVVVVTAVSAAAYASWYMHKIDQALSFDEDEREAIMNVTEPVDLSKPFYMLIMGSDLREDESAAETKSKSREGERSDVIILARVDAPNNQLTLVSIPRDTPYTLEDGTVCKINETYNIGGPAMTIEAVETTTGVDISHFAELRFSDLENMVDALGGVTVDVDTELSYKDALTGEWVTIEEGEQTLTGQQAQIFVRARHEYDTDQDVHRQNNVRQLAMAMLKAVLNKPISQIPDTVLELAQYVNTDLSASDIIKLANMFTSDITVYSCTGPNLGDISEENDGMWLCYRNPEGWAALMAAVDAGEDPSGIDVNSMAEKPKTSEESETEGTEEPAVDENGSYVPSHVSQDDEGGYVEEYGTYYYGENAEYVNTTAQAYAVPTYDGGNATNEDTTANADTGTSDASPADTGGESGGGNAAASDTGGDSAPASDMGGQANAESAAE